MRRFVVAVLCVVVLVLLGWLSFQYDGRKASVNLDMQEVRQDTHKMVEGGRAAVTQATERGKELLHDAAGK
jgi:hypothetical protein